MRTARRLLALGSSILALKLYASVFNLIGSDSSSLVAQSHGGHFQYLTILGLSAAFLHQIAYLVALATDLRFFAGLQNKLLLLSAPLAFVVSTLYWSIRAFNPRLLVDAPIGMVLSPEVDRRMHLYPIILETLSATTFAQRKWRFSLWVPVVMSALAGGYLMWTERLARANGFYPYPLLALLNENQKIGLVAAAAFAGVFYYTVLIKLQKYLSVV